MHELPEQGCESLGALRFAVVLARAPGGVVLVFNRYRCVWELPGGLIDPGETPRKSAGRELLEEAGCTARELAWLGVVEVDDGRRHLGAVFGGIVDSIREDFVSDETGGICLWTQSRAPSPLGHTDAGLLRRFG
jgi:8-oxo-dGTP diphosphatase